MLRISNNLLFVLDYQSVCFITIALIFFASDSIERLGQIGEFLNFFIGTYNLQSRLDILHNMYGISL